MMMTFEELSIAEQLDAYMRFRAAKEKVGYDLSPAYFQHAIDHGCKMFFGVTIDRHGITGDEQQPVTLEQWWAELNEAELTGIDKVPPETPEELRLADLVSNFRHGTWELLKGRYPEGSFFYLVIDDNGGCQFDTIEELRDFIEEGTARERSPAAGNRQRLHNFMTPPMRQKEDDNDRHDHRSRKRPRTRSRTHARPTRPLAC
jgi:hypothetical protein